MANLKYFYIFIIIIIVFSSRFFFSLDEMSYFSADPVIYEAAVKEFSLANKIPHLPGYYLYVKTINFLQFLGFSPSYGQVFFSIIFSVFSAIIFFLLFNKFLDYKKSFFLLLLMFSNPGIYFYGVVNENYIFDLFAGGLIYYISFHRTKILLLFPILALIAGFRQTTGLLCIPLVLYIFWENRLYIKNNIIKMSLNFILSIIIFLAWFMPMVSSIGGASEYFSRFIYDSPIPKSTFFKNLSAMISITFYFFVPILLLILLNFNKFKKIKFNFKNIDYKLILWFFTPILFFMIFHYNKGYILLPIGVIFILLALFYSQNKLNNKFIIIIIILQLLFYFLTPMSQPNYQIYLQSEKRNISKLETWAERMLTKWLPTNSHIEYLNKYHKSVNLFCKKVNEINYIDTLIILPTIDTDAFTFSIRIPEKTIIRVSKTFVVSMNDCIVENELIDLENIKNKYFISNTEFIQDKFEDSINIIYKFDDLILFTNPKFNEMLSFIENAQK